LTNDVDKALTDIEDILQYVMEDIGRRVFEREMKHLGVDRVTFTPGHIPRLLENLRQSPEMLMLLGEDNRDKLIEKLLDKVEGCIHDAPQEDEFVVKARKAYASGELELALDFLSFAAKRDPGNPDVTRLKEMIARNLQGTDSVPASAKSTSSPVPSPSPPSGTSTSATPAGVPSPTDPAAPATSPPATSPPATSPPATSPPATASPATSPPATASPATASPATASPTTTPPATTPTSSVAPSPGGKVSLDSLSGPGILKEDPAHLEDNIRRLETMLEDVAKFGRDPAQARAHLQQVRQALQSGDLSTARDAVHASSSAGVHRLPFTHGVEMELLIMKRNGNWVDGDLLEDVFTQIVYNSKPQLERLLGSEATPAFIAERVRGIELRDVNEPGHVRGKVVILKYFFQGKEIELELIGRDPHGVGVTWLMEVVTPPCVYLEELHWWLHALFKIVHHVTHSMVKLSYNLGGDNTRVCYEFVSPEDLKVHQQDPDVTVLSMQNDQEGLVMFSMGLNPSQKYQTGISYGDHHHIGITDEAERKSCYNLLRCFIPHMISLTVNSPLEGGDVPKIKYAKDVLVSSPLSYRLMRNEDQLCSGEPNTHIPYLNTEDGPAEFTRAVGKADDYSSRFVEMYPFTRYGTIEIRVIDGQLSLVDRLALSVLIQAICLKAVRLHRQGIPIPNVSPDALVENRKRALRKGMLFGLKKDDDLPSRAPGFSQVYQEGAVGSEEGELMRIIGGVRNMMWYVKDELREMGVLDHVALKPFFISAFGGTRTRLKPPITQSQYQLWVLHQHCRNSIIDIDPQTPGLLRYLEEKYAKIAQDPDFDPMLEEFGEPIIPPYLSPGGTDGGNS